MLSHTLIGFPQFLSLACHALTLSVTDMALPLRCFESFTLTHAYTPSLSLTYYLTLSHTFSALFSSMVTPTYSKRILSDLTLIYLAASTRAVSHSLLVLSQIHFHSLMSTLTHFNLALVKKKGWKVGYFKLSCKIGSLSFKQSAKNFSERKLRIY